MSWRWSDAERCFEDGDQVHELADIGRMQCWTTAYRLRAALTSHPTTRLGAQLVGPILSRSVRLGAGQVTRRDET